MQRLEMELKLSIIIWSQVWPASATKRAKKRIIRLCIKKTSIGRLVRDDPRWEAVDQKTQPLEKLHPKTLEALRHAQEGRGRLQQYVYVFAWATRFVDEHGDKKHDMQCLYAGRTNLGIDARLPNPFAWSRFFY